MTDQRRALLAADHYRKTGRPIQAEYWDRKARYYQQLEEKKVSK